MVNTINELVDKARAMAQRQRLSDNIKVGDVGCALLSDKGRIYVGKNIQSDCGIGICAEQGTISEMVGKGKTRIRKIVVVGHQGKILVPCGKCREFIYQIDNKNLDTDVILSNKKTVKLRKLLPMRWQEIYFR